MNVLVLGCGHMASAIVRGASRDENSYRYICYNPNLEKAAKLAEDVGGVALNSIPQNIDADLVMIGCKPQHFSKLASEIRGKISSRSVVLSMMAAIDVEQIKEQLQHTLVARFMPNTPVLIGKGVHVIFAPANLGPSFTQNVLNFLNKSSQIFQVHSEELLDQLTPVTGCGTGIAFYFFKLMESWGAQFIHQDQSRQLILDTFEGAIKLAQSRPDKSFSQLIDEVASKGGVTEAILSELEQKETGSHLNQALDAGLRKIDIMRKKIPG